MALPRILPRLAMVLISVALALAAGEALLRLRALPAEHPESAEQALERSASTPLGNGNGKFTLIGLVRPSPFPDIVYELKPNQQGRFRGKPVRINNLGQRGHDTTVEKPPGTFRIAGLGDSVMFGWGVGEGEPYAQLVEQRLNASAPAGQRFEFLNFAVPGYNTVMEASTLEHKALAFAPDLIVIHFIGNDLGLPHFLAPQTAEASQGHGFHSYLLDALRGRFEEAPDPESAHLEVPELVHAAAELPESMRGETIGRYASMTGRGPYERAMAHIAELARARSIPVLVMRLGEDLDPNEDIAGAAAKKNGMRALNAAPAFWSYLQRQGLQDTHDVWVKTFKIPNDGHPNAIGHQRYAEALLAELQAMGVAH